MALIAHGDGREPGISIAPEAAGCQLATGALEPVTATAAHAGNGAGASGGL